MVVAGYAKLGAQAQFALFRYLTNGQLDRGFGGSGVVTTPFSVDAVAYGVAVQSTGKIVAVGTDETTETQTVALARYLPTGALDPSFGGGGKVTTSFPGLALFKGVVIQRDAKIVAAGVVTDPVTSRYALARYLGAQ